MIFFQTFFKEMFNSLIDNIPFGLWLFAVCSMMFVLTQVI